MLPLYNRGQSSAFSTTQIPQQLSWPALQALFGIKFSIS